MPHPPPSSPDSLEHPPSRSLMMNPHLEHTHGRATGWGVGHLQFSRTVGLDPEATHPLQRLAAMQGKVNHPRLLSGMWWL